jgi:hypothetical protein
MGREAQAARAAVTGKRQRVGFRYRSSMGAGRSTRKARFARGVPSQGGVPLQLSAAIPHGVFCGFSVWRFISLEAPLVASKPVLPIPKYAFAGPGGVLPLLTSLLAPLGLPLPPLDMPVPPPPAANAKLGIKMSATVAKDLRGIAFL